MLPVTGGEPDGPGPALVLPNAATSPDGATGAAVAVTNELAHAAAAASLQLSQDPMLLQRPSLGAAFLVGMLQAMADKGLMGIESVTLLHEDGEGAEVTATTASRGGGESGEALPGAASLDAAVRMARLQTATSCTCVVRVSLPTMFSHGPYTPASSDVGSPGMILMLSASERPAWSPASEHRPLQGGGNHVPSELLSELLPFHIVVDSDGTIMQVYVGINGGGLWSSFICILAYILLIVLATGPSSLPRLACMHATSQQSLSYCQLTGPSSPSCACRPALCCPNAYSEEP